MKTAVFTASYTADFDRCRLLCDTMDAHLDGNWVHYLLVERRDVSRFSALRGPRRIIVDEREILPNWIRSFPDPLSLGARRIWLSPTSLPLRGWHVQQLRRLGMARLIDEPVIFSADSDVALVRPFDPADLWQGDRLWFYCRENSITDDALGHITWSKVADRVLGNDNANQGPPCHDYINTLIAWRTDTLKALLTHIEQVNGTSWMKAITRSRAISECTLYGRYVDFILNGEGHVHTRDALCHVMWFDQGQKYNHQDLVNFIAQIESHQIGVGIQSFIGCDIEEIRKLVLP